MPPIVDDIEQGRDFADPFTDHGLRLSTSPHLLRMPTETTQSLQEKIPATDIFSHIEVADGRVWLKRDGVPSFAGDLPEDEQKLVWATHAAPVADLFIQKVDGTAWRSKPSWYIVATKDPTIQPESERFVAKRMGATVFETDSSHVPMLSQPDFVLDVIRKAATAVQEDKAA